MATPRPVTPAFYSSAPIRFSATRPIAATPDEVFAALADTPSWPKWFPALTGAQWTSGAPFGVGSTRTVEVGPVKIEEKFIAWEPGSRWGFTFLKTTLPFVRAGAELVELVKDGERTKVTYTMFLDPLPGLGVVTRVLRRGVEKGLSDGLRGLERHLAAQS